jgi:hypothetical protein
MYYEKGNLRDITCKMQDARFDVSFRDCPAKGRTGGHPIPILSQLNPVHTLTNTVSLSLLIIIFVLCQLEIRDPG